jgi:D-alanyl-lipoteichoic acid acyltransferase DltB (MBOAT superfamily)
MLFNTLIFWAFFAIVLVVFYSSRGSARKVVLLAASYTFYGMWDWRFLSLIIISTLTDYICARLIGGSENEMLRRRILVVSVSVNLGILGFFKYFNFFTENAVALLNAIGIGASPFMINVVLPVGISFYTFQTMSYTIDVYRRNSTPTRSLLDFANFVAFFPQLVAGPIERAHHLLPQISVLKRASTEQVLDGVSLMLLGLFYKVYVADNLANIVDAIYAERGFPAACIWLPLMLLRSRYSETSPGTPPLRGDWPSAWASTSWLTSMPPISQPGRENSGGAGTSACRAGCATISTYRLAETAPADS